MIKLFKHLKPKEWLMALVSLVFIVTQVWLELKIPEYMSKVTILTQTPGSPMSEIWLNGGYMMLSALGSLVAAVIVGYFAAKISASYSQRLRGLLFNKVESFSLEEMNFFSTPSLITRSTNDVTQVQMLVVMSLQLLIKAPITAAWAITKIYDKGLEWSLVTAFAVVFVLSIVGILMAIAMPKFKKMQELTDNLTRVSRENLTGVRVVRAYNAEDYQEEKFDEANTALTNTQLFTTRVMSIMMPVMTVLMSALPLAIYWIGAYLINEAQMMDKIVIFSDMVVFSSYAIQIVMSFMMLVMIFVMYPRASVSAKRINEVLDMKPKIISGNITQGVEGMEGVVEFKNVYFQYPDAAESIIENISFKANKGETVAFIGSTGSGKSTLINLVPRFFDATQGEVLIGGVNVKDYDSKTLFNKIGYVPQKAILFKGTVESNIAFGENGKPKDIKENVKSAVRIAQGMFVEDLEEGYQSHVAQGGTNFSGGQKQRLAIARAIARDPEIYIFDDSFSALDYKTDRVLRSALKEETKGVTSLIVAQRIGTIMDADQIIVLDEGKMVGIGTHEALLKSCDVYLEIAKSQLSEEELNL